MLGYAVFLRTMASLLQASLLTLSAEGKVRRELRRGTDVIAIHGDSVFAVAMARDLIEAGQVVAISDPETVRALGEQGLVDAQELDIAFKAPNQVIIYENDADALEFLESNSSAMDDDARVYIHLDSIETEGLVARHLFPFSLAKLCAGSIGGSTRSIPWREALRTGGD